MRCPETRRRPGRAASDAPPSRLPDGTPRYLDIGGIGYTGVEPGQPLPEWLDLFGTPRGHGNTFLGFYLAKDFKCRKLEE